MVWQASELAILSLMTPPVSLKLSNDPATIGVARRFLRSQLGTSCDGNVLDDLQLVVSELVTNAIQYSPNHPIWVSVDRRPTEVEIAVSGVGSQLGDASWSMSSHTAPHGRGLAIVRAIADDVRVGPGPHGRSVVVTKRLP